ncbi:MAG: EscU/YscU/HrcU family type secretion system export apparatus switch protein [Herminiimonas sp.]|nr:EscU/YscU/HrcU family type secretion system export apparatus switch protein [Herminiimonas sp.]
MSSEKTEQPTSNKIKKAREDGQVAKSKDFTQVLLMGALFGYTLADSEAIVRRVGQILLMPPQLYEMDFRGAVAIGVTEMARSGLILLFPYLLIVIVVGVCAEMLQTGVLFAFKALMPKGDKLSPAKNAKNIFSMKNVIEFIKSAFKVIFLTAVVYYVMRQVIDPLLKLPYSGIDHAGMMLVVMLKTLVIYTFIGFAVIAFFDFIYQRHSYTKGLMMSMEEIKQEYKQMEGDPHVKSHRRGLAKEIAMGEMEQKTKKSTVVVTNPTHFAVALYYDEIETPLPIVLAKGADAVARAIVRVARAENIPVMENVPLARALMATAPVNQYIPSELVEPVAEVLLALRRLAQERDEGEFDA